MALEVACTVEWLERHQDWTAPCRKGERFGMEGFTWERCRNPSKFEAPSASVRNAIIRSWAVLGRIIGVLDLTARSQ